MKKEESKKKIEVKGEDRVKRTTGGQRGTKGIKRTKEQ